VKFPLCLINQRARHEIMGESGYAASPLLISAVDGGEWSTSRPCRFNPGKRTLCTHCREVGLTQSRCGRCGGDTNIFVLSGDRFDGRPARNPSAELSRLSVWKKFAFVQRLA
jgi:hypothetical protein